MLVCTMIYVLLFSGHGQNTGREKSQQLTQPYLPFFQDESASDVRNTAIEKVLKSQRYIMVFQAFHDFSLSGIFLLCPAMAGGFEFQAVNQTFLTLLTCAPEIGLISWFCSNSVKI